MQAATPAVAAPRRTRELVQRGDAAIDVVVDTPAAGSGPCVVLLPSSLRDSLDFDPLAQQLAAAGLLVLRPQPRGMGRSTGPVDQLTLAVLADDVAHVIDQLGPGRAVIVGHAFGHFVARVADLNHAHAVRGVVIAGAAARTFPPGMAESLALASDTTQPDGVRIGALRHAFFAEGNDPTPWLDGWYPALRAPYRAAGSVPPKDAWWPVSHAPVLDLQGAQDPWRPPASRDELQQALGADRVTVEVIEGASHALVVEQPAAIASAIMRWMRALPA